MRRLNSIPQILFSASLLLALPACGGGGSSDDTGTGDESGDEGADGGDDGEMYLEPAPGGVRRLLARQYVASIDLMLGEAAANAAIDELPTDFPLNDFDAIGAAELSLADPDIEQYERAATAAADAVVANLDTLGETAPCVLEAAPADSCYDEVIDRLGHYAWRRPLEDDERGRLRDIALAGRAWDNTFGSGLKYMLMAILQSPNFIYLKEVGEPDSESGFRKLDPAEQLSRATFFLLGRTPELWMLEKAESGDLDDDEAVRGLAEALVTDAAARENLAAYYDELYRLREVPTMQKDTGVFANYDSDLAEMMRQETLRFIEHIVWDQDGDAMDILSANYTFVNEDLAAIYGISGISGTGYQQATFPDGQNRAGFLSQSGFLTRHSHPAKNSPTRRGVFIQTKILCADIPPPPAGVDTQLPADDGEPKTLREKLEIHMEDETCNACHSLVDPIGFGLENFDPIGQYRTEELNGLSIDASGSVAGLGEWNNAAELADLLRNDPRAAQCVVRNLLRNGLGHVETPGEAPSIVQFSNGFTDNSFNLQDLLVEMASSRLFQLVDEPK